MVVVGRRALSVAEVVAVARGGEGVEVADDLDATMAPSRTEVVNYIYSGRVV